MEPRMPRNPRLGRPDRSGAHERDERHVWYMLVGPDLDPQAISARTGIEPDQAWRAGEPRPRTGAPYAEGAWLLESGLPRSAEFHDHLDALIARLRPAWEAFIDLGRRHKASVGAAITSYGAQGPLVQVSPDVSAALAEINATLGFDLYALAGDRESS